MDSIKSSDFFAPKSSINLYYFNSSTAVLHEHVDFFEIFIITKGTVLHTFNGKTTVMGKRDACIIRPGDRHGFAADPSSGEDSQHMNIRIMPSLFEQICNSIGYQLYNHILNAQSTLFHLSKQRHSQVNFWTNMLFTSTKPENDSLYITTIAHLLLVFYYLSLDASGNAFPAWFGRLLTDINNIDFIDKSAKDIYELAHYSPNHTIKTFKKYLGMTPTEYLNKLKLNYASNLLKNTDYSVLHISNTIGFSSLSYFMTMFKKAYGVSPAEYRRSN